VDDDMVFTVEDVRNLLNTEGDIVSGLAVTRSEYPKPVVFDRTDKGFEYMKVVPNDVSEVDGTTLAFTKIRMSVFDKIGTSFQFRPNMGEDLDFCARAKDAGFKIVINPKVRIGHIAQRVLYA